MIYCGFLEVIVLLDYVLIKLYIKTDLIKIKYAELSIGDDNFDSTMPILKLILLLDMNYKAWRVYLDMIFSIDVEFCTVKYYTLQSAQAGLDHPR